MNTPIAANPDPPAVDLAMIEAMNRQYLRAGEQSDVHWYAENLTEDYLCSSADGSLINRAAFLARVTHAHQLHDFMALDTRIRFVGELALVHAGFSCTKPDGQPGSGRYTDIYIKREQRWCCVSAHFNFF